MIIDVNNISDQPHSERFCQGIISFGINQTHAHVGACSLKRHFETNTLANTNVAKNETHFHLRFTKDANIVLSIFYM